MPQWDTILFKLKLKPFHLTIMDKRRITITKLTPAQSGDHGFMDGTMAERLSNMWELTKSGWALMPDYDAKQRLQRHVAVLTRGER